MKSISWLIFTITLVFASSAMIADDDTHRRHGDALEIEGAAESLLGLSYRKEGLGFQVRSSGCTEKEHFVVQRLVPEDQTSVQLLLIRVDEDYCDAYVPFGIWIDYTYRELQLEQGTPFKVLNPLANYRVVDFD
jgi:hypothetical protein